MAYLKNGFFMEKDLRSYIKVFDNVIDDELCNQTVKDLQKQNVNWEQHSFYSQSPNKGNNMKLSGNRELFVTFGPVSTIESISNCVARSYTKYVEELNFFWFNNWVLFCNIRFNRYEKDQVMATHCDHIHSMFDGNVKGIPVLTCLGSLNDDYEGGELVMFGDEVIEMKKGSIMIFPSCFLYPHKVDAVTKGTRYSFVSWAV